jgi:1-acyl-sn-glycerol-3-phosphate acyltransferase
MQVSKIKNSWLVFLTIFEVFFTSAQILFYALFGRCTRARANNLNYKMSKRVLKLIDAKLTVVDPYNTKFEPDRCYILMSNHASVYDIPIILMTFPQQNIRMLVKQELFKVPIWGWAMRTAEYISIDRANVKQAIADLQVAREKLNSGIILWISPEGTRSRTGELGRLKKGGFKIAMQARAIIIPIRIIDSDKIAPPDLFKVSIGENPKVLIGKQIDAADYNDILVLKDDVENAIKAL